MSAKISSFLPVSKPRCLSPATSAPCAFSFGTVSMKHVIRRARSHMMKRNIVLLVSPVYGLCRCGEITTKTQKAFSPATDHLRSDITTYGTAADGYFDFNIRCSKTDVYRRSVLLRIFGVGPTAEHCPARAVRQYLDATSERPANSPLFALSNGKYVTRNMVNDMIKRLCGLAGFDPAKYSTHSMRAGGASSLALSGVDSATIRKLGRWESDCFIRYITISDDRRRELAVAMATLPPTSDEVRKARWVALRQAL